MIHAVRIHFVREFTSGALKGLTHKEWIQFVSRDRAAKWCRGIRRNARAGLLDYRLQSFSVEHITINPLKP